MQNKKTIHYICVSAVIAAAYVALTFFSNIFGLAYGPIQFRISEVLTVLPALTPAAIPGLTVGCFIANIASFNALDMIFGTAATLIAALFTYWLRDIKIKGIPFLSFLPPIIVNAVIIGFEISWFFLPEGLSLWGFVISAIEVGIGQLVVCYGLGTPFYILIKKYRLF